MGVVKTKVRGSSEGVRVRQLRVGRRLPEPDFHVNGTDPTRGDDQRIDVESDQLRDELGELPQPDEDVGDQVSTRRLEVLEWIVILLIALEIFLR